MIECKNKSFGYGNNIFFNDRNSCHVQQHDFQNLFKNNFFFSNYVNNKLLSFKVYIYLYIYIHFEEPFHQATSSDMFWGWGGTVKLGKSQAQQKVPKAFT